MLRALLLAALAVQAPYLQNGQPDRITLVWRQASPGSARVQVATEFGQVVFDRTVAVEQQAEVEVKGLHPGEHYRYCVKLADGTRHEARFQANLGPEVNHLRFGVMGDMGYGSPAQFAVAKQLAGWRPDLVLTVGDNVYMNATEEDFDEKFFKPYGAQMANTPFYPALGNHDLRTDNGAPYLKAFALPGNERYYAFDDGPARFWVLDSNQPLHPGSAQYEWLAADAAASDAPWKFAFLHHPPYSSGLHGQEGRNRRWLPPLFSKLGFAAVFAGHDHHYERSKPIDGVTYIVTGGGGALLYGAGELPFQATRATRHEFVGVSIYEDTLAIVAIDDKGEAIDAVTLKRPLRSPKCAPARPW
jgi:hypothetical protein